MPDPPAEASATPALAVLGCGAISEAFHIPALARHAKVRERLVLVDPDLGRARERAEPTITYGPFSALWTEEFAERLQVRPRPSPRSCAVAPAPWSTSTTGWRGSGSHWTGPIPSAAGSSTAAAPRK